jgi:hypothetical protein
MDNVDQTLPATLTMSLDRGHGTVSLQATGAPTLDELLLIVGTSLLGIEKILKEQHGVSPGFDMAEFIHQFFSKERGTNWLAYLEQLDTRGMTVN